MKQQQSGFTLVEIAIVLVIIGLLLGGILKGQELITNAKVRNVADQQNSVKAAFFAFQDRFRALPGDYTQGAANIPNTVAPCDVVTSTSKLDTTKKSICAWHQITNAGFISCSVCSTDHSGDAAISSNNSPVNAYNGAMTVFWDADFNNAVGAANPVNNLKSGSQVPSNVLAEVDRKIDDGNPSTGSFRYSNNTAAGTVTAGVAACTTTTSGTGAGSATSPAWAANPPESNCGAAGMF